MKLLLLTVLLITLNSCGGFFGGDNISNPNPRPFHHTDAAFLEHIQEFEESGAKETGNQNFNIGDVPVIFGDTENESYKGVCITYTDSKKGIIIDKQWWDSATSEFQESLIFHELGHCVLGRSHKDDTQIASSSAVSTNGSAASSSTKEYKLSMMNSKIISPSDYKPLREAYITELFNSSSTVLETLFSAN